MSSRATPRCLRGRGPCMKLIPASLGMGIEVVGHRLPTPQIVAHSLWHCGEGDPQ